jgi:hypothetical protein
VSSDCPPSRRGAAVRIRVLSENAPYFYVERREGEAERTMTDDKHEETDDNPENKKVWRLNPMLMLFVIALIFALIVGVALLLPRLLGLR